MKQAHKTIRNQRGTALVEMTMILPVLTILFLGIVQFGLVLREHQVVQNAAREGARLSMVKVYDCKESDASNNTLSTIGNLVTQYLNQENISVTVGGFTDCPVTTGTATLSGGGILSGSITIDQD